MEWGAEIVAECAPIAVAMDAALGGTHHQDALASAGVGLRDASTLPSARVLDAVKNGFDDSFINFVRAQSEKTRTTLQELPFSLEWQAHFNKLSLASLLAQEKIEKADTMLFEAYRQQYVSPDRLGVPRREAVSA